MWYKLKGKPVSGILQKEKGMYQSKAPDTSRKKTVCLIVS